MKHGDSITIYYQSRVTEPINAHVIRANLDVVEVEFKPPGSKHIKTMKMFRNGIGYAGCLGGGLRFLSEKQYYTTYWGRM